MVAFVILTVIPSSIVIWRISKVQKSWIIQWAFLLAIPRLHNCVCSFYGAAVMPVSAWDQSQCFGIARQALCQRAGSSAVSLILWLDHQSFLEDWETELPERDTLTCWAACSLCRELQVSHIDSFVMGFLWVISAPVRSPNETHWFTKLNFGGSLTLVFPKFPIWDE